MLKQWRVDQDSIVSLVRGHYLYQTVEGLLIPGTIQSSPDVIDSVELAELERIGGPDLVQEFRKWAKDNAPIPTGAIFVGKTAGGGNAGQGGQAGGWNAEVLFRYMVDPTKEAEGDAEIDSAMAKMIETVMMAANDRGIKNMAFAPLSVNSSASTNCFGVAQHKSIKGARSAFNMLFEFMASKETSIAHVRLVFENDGDANDLKIELQMEYEEFENRRPKPPPKKTKIEPRTQQQFAEQQQREAEAAKQAALEEEERIKKAKKEEEEQKRKQQIIDSLRAQDYYIVPIYQLNYDKMEPDSDETIMFFEEKEGEKQVTVIKCATLAKLIERVTYHQNYDSNFLYAFLLTYRSFTTPTALFEALVVRYNIPPPRNCSKEEFYNFKIEILDPVRLRVCQVIRYWVEKHFYDFDEDLISRLEDFIQNTLLKTKMEPTAKNLQKILDRKKSGKEEEHDLSFNTDPPKPLARTKVKLNKNTKVDVFDWPTKEISRQITLIESAMFRKIQPKECLNQSWNKDNRETKAPNIFAMISRFNLVSRWAALKVVSEEKLEKRIQVLAKLIKLADDCQELHNFNAVFEIISGLNSAPVHRLKKTWEGLPVKSMATYKRLQALISRDHNFREIRAAIVHVSPPSIPYIGIYLTDLTFIEDGNPNLLNDKINFVKRRKLAQVIRDLQTHQQTAYRLEDVEELQAELLKLENLTEDEMYELSLLREERAKKKVSTD